MSKPYEALQIRSLIGRYAATLRFPEGFGEELEHRMLGGVDTSEPRRKLAVHTCDAARSVGCNLLADRKVQAHVQKRVLLATFRCELGGGRSLICLEPAHIFGMLGDDRGNLRLERLKQLMGRELAPRGEVHPPQLLAIVSGKNRHRGASSSQRAIGCLRRGRALSPGGVL